MIDPRELESLKFTNTKMERLHEERSRSLKKVTTFVYVLFAAYTAFCLSVLGGLVYVAIHFIQKFW